MFSLLIYALVIVNVSTAHVQVHLPWWPLSLPEYTPSYLVKI